MNIFKEVCGNGDDVVVIHGWGCNHRDMQPVVEELSDRYRVTNIDLPGIGTSDWDPRTETIYDIAEQVLPHLPQKAIYVGWSFGGLVSMAIAVRHPVRVKRFIGVNTTPKFIEGENWPGFPAPGFCVAFDVLKEKGLKVLLKDDFANEFATFDPKPSQYERLVQILDQSPEIPQHVLFKGIELGDKTDLRQDFAAIQCPIDLIMGEADFKVLIAAVPEIKKLNPRAHVHSIAGAKHLPFWTHPQEFKGILRKII